MIYSRHDLPALLKAFGAVFLFAAIASAQIPGLCNTGQTRLNLSGCTSALVTPNPFGGGPNRDGNWELGVPYPSALPENNSACGLTTFIPAWVDTPQSLWLPNSAGSASEWITPFNGENVQAKGYYVYRIAFHVPLILPGGIVPSGVTINGQLSSDNATYGIYLKSPKHSLKCSLVAGPLFPLNPEVGFQQWYPFSFSNVLPLTPGEDAFLYFVVQNELDMSSPQGFRLEFLDTSKFN